MELETGTLVPPRRLGSLLRQARVAAGRELSELASHTELTVVDLDDIEHGRRMVSDPLLRELVHLYGVEEAGLVPKRSQLIIDLDEGRVSMDEIEMTVGDLVGPDAVLTRYLGLVYRLRELPLGTPIPLREVDLEVLSSALHIEADEVDARLRQLMDDEDDIARDQKRIRRRVLLPLIGVVIAASASGVLVLVAENEPAPDPGTSASAVLSAVDDSGSARISTGAVVDAPEVVTDLGNGAAVVENSTAG